MRSTVSADISKSTIWVNSTDFKSTVKAVKIHQHLIGFFGYDDGCILEESRRGAGVSITVCGLETVQQLKADYAQAKREEKAIPTTAAHEQLARELLEQMHG